MFKFFHSRDSDIDDLKYFECEDDVEAALNFLDNHPNCTIEEYEEWLSKREKAIKEIKENYGNKNH